MNQIDSPLNKSDETTGHNQLLSFLERYKLSQYHNAFVSEGFDRLLSLFDITETDLISLNVKRGHRRLLQRAIATARGVPISTPILINYGYDEPSITHTPKPGTIEMKDAPEENSTLMMDYQEESSPPPYYQRQYRKRKHQYIPSKPVTPFDEFLNEIKAEYKDQMTSSQMTCIAYERWNKLSAVEKDKYEREALHANSDYVMDGYFFSSSEDDLLPAITTDIETRRSVNIYCASNKRQTPELDYLTCISTTTSSTSRCIPHFNHHYSSSSSEH